VGGPAILRAITPAPVLLELRVLIWRPGSNAAMIVRRVAGWRRSSWMRGSPDVPEHHPRHPIRDRRPEQRQSPGLSARVDGHPRPCGRDDPRCPTASPTWKKCRGGASVETDCGSPSESGCSPSRTIGMTAECPEVPCRFLVVKLQQYCMEKQYEGGWNRPLDGWPDSVRWAASSLPPEIAWYWLPRWLLVVAGAAWVLEIIANQRVNGRIRSGHVS